MLLLYTRLVRQILTPLEWDIKPNQETSHSAKLEQFHYYLDSIANPQREDKTTQTKDVYPLTRRFLL
ncbi:MAG TPA: hypothetical protein DC064_02480 [Cyanobacteria bacterium UBA9273]|nr:hypothetical protein [Cyanobacteria bacterium UBA9273]